MNLLIDGLPETVEVGGMDVPISTDFRTGILFEQVLQDADLDDYEKLITAIRLYYPNVVFEEELIEEAIRKMTWFYRCGSEPPPRKKSDEEGDGDAGGSEEAFSFEHDADYIYAAFMQAYGLDLAVSPLHWWQFRALFRSLPEDTLMSKIIGYRTMKIPEKASKEQRQHYNRLKRIYALPKSADRQKLESDLIDLLMNGGNPAAFLNGEVKSWEQMEP